MNERISDEITLALEMASARLILMEIEARKGLNEKALRAIFDRPTGAEGK